jgi:hypothetical protein
VPRPADEGGYPQAALEQIGLPAAERPDIGKPLAAVVAGEHDDGVARHAGRFESLQNPTHLPIHLGNHSGKRGE